MYKFFGIIATLHFIFIYFEAFVEKSVADAKFLSANPFNEIFYLKLLGDVILISCALICRCIEKNKES